MSLSTILTGQGFEGWLRAVVPGANVSSRITPASPLDVHGTSLRLLRQGRQTLGELASGTQVTANDKTQRLGDLRSQGLVERHVDELTPLGRNVLKGWRDLNVDNEHGEDEPVRAALLMREAVRQGLKDYTDIRQRWESLVTLVPGEVWLNNPDALLLYSYIDFTEPSTGYNAWRELVPWLDGSLALMDLAEWETLGDSIDPPPGWEISRLAALLRRLDVSRRSAGRQTFCMALEAERLATVAPTRLAQALVTWTVIVA